LENHHAGKKRKNVAGRKGRNHHESANHRVLFKLIGTKSNQAAIGARLTVKAGTLTQFDEVACFAMTSPDFLNRIF
jgi:hypothetical protein